MDLAGLYKCTAYSSYQIFWKSVDWVFPPECGGCGKVGLSWCLDCRNKLIVPQEFVCLKCGLPDSKTDFCSSCKRNAFALEYLRSISEYTEPMRSAIIRMKKHSDYGLGLSLSKYLVSMFHNLNRNIDAVVPVPINKSHLIMRGYNQTEMFTYPFSLAIHSPYRLTPISRIRETRSQVGLNALERYENVKGAVKAVPPYTSGNNVHIIDDVATTCSSISACSEALLSAGAKSVHGITLARPIFSNTNIIPKGI
jgi:competence protein ComFC